MAKPDTSIDPRIMDSAKEEFRTLGFERASLKSICQRAGVTTGALYKRYAGKEELFRAVVADTVADWLADQGAAVAVANNGGDVALRLAPGQSLRLRTVIDLRTGETSQPALIQAGAGIGGICTSGLGGRSFTRGIAESVTVFAARANVADALATHLANCSFIDSPRVASTLAVNLDPQTDIPELEVVTATDILPEEELHRAITQVLEEAGRQYSAGLLIRMEGSIQGRRFAFPGNAVHEP